jgi:hypothetical protein
VLALAIVAVVTTGVGTWIALARAVVVFADVIFVAVPMPGPPRQPPPSHHYVEMYARGIESQGESDAREDAARRPPPDR